MSDPTAKTASVSSPKRDETDGSAPGVSIASIVWSLVLSLAVLVVIGVVTFEPDTFTQMLRVNPWLLLLAMLTVLIRIFLGTWRLHYISKNRLSWLGALRAQLAWDFFSNVTPSTIGGGPIAPTYISRDSGLPLGEATSIMLFAMLMDQVWFTLAIPLLVVLGFYVEVIPNSLGMLGVSAFMLYFLGFMVWVLIFGYSTLVRPRLLEKFVGRLFRIKGLRRFRQRALGMMDQLKGRARVLRTQRPWFYVKGFLLTIAVWLSRYLLVVIILWSVYPAVDKLLVLLRTITLMLGALILPTPGGAGGIEGLYALLIGPLIPEALVGPTLLTWRLMGFYLFIALGAYLTVHQVHTTIRRKKHERALDDSSSSNGTSVVHASEPAERTE